MPSRHYFGHAVCDLSFCGARAYSADAGARRQRGAGGADFGRFGLADVLRITLPSIKWALVYGDSTNARAMGEFGAVSVVSCDNRGETNTIPLLVEIFYNEYKLVRRFRPIERAGAAGAGHAGAAKPDHPHSKRSCCRRKERRMSITLQHLNKHLAISGAEQHQSECAHRQLISPSGPSGCGKPRFRASSPGWSMPIAARFIRRPRCHHQACARTQSGLWCFNTMPYSAT